MEIKVTGIIFGLLVILPMVIYAMAISVEVESSVDGRNTFLEFDNSSPISVKLDWENIGSVDCNTRLRVDILENSSKIYTSWSKNSALAPGGGDFFEIYYLPDKNGNYSADVKLDYCNELVPITSFNFTFSKPEFGELNLPVKTSSTKSEITFILEPDRNLSEVIIMPKDFPRGWIVNSVRVEDLKKGEPKTVVLEYEPAVWMPKNVTFNIISEGKCREVEVELKESKDYTFVLINLGIALLIVSIALNFYFLVKYRKNRKNGDHLL